MTTLIGVTETIKPIGIPYASYAYDPQGNIQVDIVVCPICHKQVKLTGKKDSETFDRAAYQKHYQDNHT